jgi:DNA-directed RNA polymerase beta' subunit
MLAPNNIFSPSSGKPITTPTQDIALGCYYLTIESQKDRIRRRQVKAKASGGAPAHLNDALECTPRSTRGRSRSTTASASAIPTTSATPITAIKDKSVIDHHGGPRVLQ